MKGIKPGDKLLVHAYKHNGVVYRSWERPLLIEKNEEHVILYNDKVVINEKKGTKWVAKEPALWFFPHDKWFNILCMFKNGCYEFYCNLASPYIYEENTIKFIDYDLDVKVYKDFSYRILDLVEFNRNRIKWEYGPKIVEIIWDAVVEIKRMIKEKSGFFDLNFIKELKHKINS
ncbi:DUF402 domain-containing protein [Spiroplasma endosymbiont of Crioceris asparagi]|uniref:DUF402 domain-containing protein n=1 Tax=Spiroplasma endosymbiont of Crioceris asparagi TaxID=3066286 RepID=UPI0030CFBE88